MSSKCCVETTPQKSASAHQCTRALCHDPPGMYRAPVPRQQVPDHWLSLLLRLLCSSEHFEEDLDTICSPRPRCLFRRSPRPRSRGGKPVRALWPILANPLVAPAQTFACFIFKGTVEVAIHGTNDVSHVFERGYGRHRNWPFRCEAARRGTRWANQHR